jgi:hypothetical protein
MTRLTLVVGQLRCALVAGAMLIAGCGGDDAPARSSGSDAAAGPVSQPGDAGSAADLTGADASAGDKGVLDAAIAPSADAAVAGPDARPPTGDAAPDATYVVRDAGYDGASAARPGPPAPWLATDIGTVSRKGETTSTTTWFAVLAGGSDVGGAADSFHFLYQPLTGDGALVARVAALGGSTDPGSKAGIMIRAGLEAGAANVFLAVVGDPAVGGRLQHRAYAGGPTAAMPADTGMKTGQFLRLARSGKTITAFRSANRSTWTRVGSVDLDLPATAYVGLATEAHSNSNTVQANYNYAAIDNLAADPATAPWEHVDVGTLGGSAAQAGGVLKLTGYGEAFSTTQDYFSGVVQPVSGSYRLTALLEAQTGSEPEARAGLMFREGLVATASRSSAFAAITVSQGKGLQFHGRGAQGGMTSAGARKMEAKLPLWLRIEKTELGPQDRFAGYYSTDGTSWTLLDAVSFNAAEPLLVGAVAGAGGAAAMNTARVSALTAVPLLGDGGLPDAATPVAAGDAARD